MICQWKIGDVFAYRLESEYAKEKGLYGRYILLQKVDECPWYPNHIIPIVYVRMTQDDKLPNCVEEFEQSIYIQTGVTNYERRFWPYDFSRLEEDIAEKSKIKYEVDEYGYLQNFRIKMISTSKRVISKNLEYVGNFKNIVLPSKEFIPHSTYNIQPLYWKELEKCAIDFYFNFNLKQAKLYKQVR